MDEAEPVACSTITFQSGRDLAITRLDITLRVPQRFGVPFIRKKYYKTPVVRYCLFSGILANCRLLLILGRTLAYHSQASRTTSPSASYGVGISE
jgi:hypothetical protein